MVTALKSICQVSYQRQLETANEVRERERERGGGEGEREGVCVYIHLCHKLLFDYLDRISLKIKVT